MEQDLKNLKSAIQESACGIPLVKSIAHSYLPTESVSSRRVQAYRGSVDNWHGDGIENRAQSYISDQWALRKVQDKSKFDIIERYIQAETDVYRGNKPIEDKILSLDHGRAGSSKNVLLSKVFQKSFQLRSHNKGKFRDQAFVLEEMTKKILDDHERNGGVLIRKTSEGIVEDSNKETAGAGASQSIERITKVDKVIEFLLLMNGQANKFDSNKRKEKMSEFGSNFLADSLRKSNDVYGMSPSTAQSESPSNSLFGVRIDEMSKRVHTSIADQIEACHSTNLFGSNILGPNNIGFSAPKSKYDQDYEHFNQKSDGYETTPLSSFFTLYTSESFYNPGLAKSMDVKEINSNHQSQSQLQKLVAGDVAPINRFNVTFWGLKNETKMEQEQDEAFSGLKALNQGQIEHNTATTQGQVMQAFKIGNNAKDSSFSVNLGIPPLPSLAQSTLIDPTDPLRGEKLITKTFFSYGNENESPAGLPNDKQAVASFFRQRPDGDFEKLADGPKQQKPQSSSKRAMKQVDKSLKKRAAQQVEEKRRKLLVSLFPYVDESKLEGNLDAECGIKNLWEDEHLDYQMNRLQVSENALVTQQKVLSFQEQLSLFQNSVIQAKDQVLDKVNESVLTEADLVDKGLLLLQGIPSSGVFDLVQDTFTFSMNGNRRVFMTADDDRDRPSLVKLRVNQNLFEDMMEAGGYFLHLKEFAECMQNAENAQHEDATPVGKVLQAFSLSVADFLTYYQQQVIDFQNQVRKRRRFEDILLFGMNHGPNGLSSQEAESQRPTLVELKVHLGSLIAKLKLLATICFTQKFIDDITEVKKVNQQEQIKEQEEEGFEKFQELLYGKGESKFTAINLQMEFEKNLEVIRNQSWLEEFPRGAPLLTYLYKILVCCEADLQAVDLLRTIFSKSVQPLLQMISEFIYTGDFNDPFGEFFIEKVYKIDKKGPDNDEHLFKLTSDVEKIPSFVGPVIAQKIFEVGSHVNLLQMLDAWTNNQGSNLAITSSIRQLVQKRDYYDICNVATQSLENQQKALKSFVHPTRIISDQDEVCLKLRFDIQDLQTDLDLRKEFFTRQIEKLAEVEQAIVASEKKQVQSLIQMKQESVERFQRERDAQLKEKRAQVRAQKAAAMKILQDQISETRSRKAFEEREAAIERQIQENERMQIEQIKQNIAEELKKQYLLLIQNENQALGDIRDADVKNQDKLNREIEELIQEGQKKKEQIQNEIQQSEEPQVAQEDVEMEDLAEKRPRFRADTNLNKASKQVDGKVSDQLEQTLNLDDIGIAFDDMEQVPNNNKKIEQVAPQEEESEAAKYYFIHQIFTKPLITNIWHQIDENRRAAHKRRTWKLRKQDQEIKNAQQMRQKWKYQAPIISMRHKLSGIIEDFTNEREKIEIHEIGTEHRREETINVPVHLALNQCVITSIKDQFKVVNKCMLHMMYRKRDLLGHLKALKIFYLSGQGDILNHFASQLFHQNQACGVKDNSLYFFNACYEEAIKAMNPTGSIYSKPGLEHSENFLQGNHILYSKQLKFEYIGSTKKKEDRMKMMMMDLHNLDTFITLKYQRDYPVDLVLTDQCIVKYNRIFFTLLKVKQILILLKDCWKELSSRDFKRLGQGDSQKLRQMQGLRAMMHNFMSTFEEYIMIDAIEAGWEALKKKMANIQVFEELISIHNEYLDKILDKSMLGRKETKIAQFITQVFECIQKFCALIHEYQSAVVTSESAFEEFITLKDQFVDQIKFFRRFVAQLAVKGHYRELNGRIMHQNQIHEFKSQF